jgi:hypothetical protein
MKINMAAIVGFCVFLQISIFTAQAKAAYYAPSYTCAELKKIVASEGGAAIQMRIGFNYYYSSASACSMGTAGVGVVYGTRDRGTCVVGFVCNFNEGGGNG